MADLDADGNVINNQPAHSARLKRGSTDISRVIEDKDPTVFSHTRSGSGGSIAGSGGVNLAKYQTVADITGVTFATGGIEVSVGVDQFGSNRSLTPIVRFKDAGAATGDVAEGYHDAFFLTHSETGSIVSGDNNPTFFIPCHDLRRVQIGQTKSVTNNAYNAFGFGSHLKIKVV